MQTTNIMIDEDMIKRAMEVSGLQDQRKIVEAAILDFIAKHDRKDLRELQGKIEFAEGYDYKELRKRA